VRERIADWKLTVSRQQQQEQAIIRAEKITASLLQDSPAVVKPDPPIPDTADAPDLEEESGRRTR
jgi:hypothetical protein